VESTRNAGRGRLWPWLGLGVVIGMSAGSAAASPGPQTIATFSIVAYDSATGDLGVAVQSKFFAVGSVVPWARAGIGAIATQASGNTTFGPRGLDLLAQGLPPAAVLDSLLAGDPGRETRQVGIVDAKGVAVAHTGKECQKWAGHRTGKYYSVQGNILAGEAVVASMERGYLSAPPGPLGGRLIAALQAGQEAGGDSRGMQSAALYVVRAKGGYGGFNDRYCDLRVDDHTSPIAELQRLYMLWLPNALILEGYQLADVGRTNEAVARGEAAIAADPKSPEGYYHTACYLARAGRAEPALDRLAEAIARDPKIKQRASTDPDFTKVHDDKRYRELVGETTAGK
jgi:uncharacterized Ntn-hydrolase superfamily protein